MICVNGESKTLKYCPTCSSELEKKIIENIEREACPDILCNFKNWENPVPVAAGILKYNDKYILARNSEWEQGVFSMISGFVDKYEVPEETIAREVNEEVGLLCNDIQFIGHFKFKKMNQLIIAFHVDVVGELKLGSEIVETKLISKEELVVYDFGLFTLTRNIVDAMLQNNKCASQ